MIAKQKIRVIVVDDSQMIRELFTNILNSATDIEVVASAHDPYEARELIKSLNPDVITLDVEMPKMDGISFLEKIMRLRPMPVVMVSSLTQKGAHTTLRALELGAVDYVSKQTSRRFDSEALGQELIDKVRLAARAKLSVSKEEKKKPPPSLTASLRYNSDALIAIGSSTGGVEALKELLTPLPQNMPPIVITQHMPETFTNVFARRLNELCALSVHETKDGTHLEAGNVYIAPGNKHLILRKNSKGYTSVLSDADPVSGHRPSVDVMFNSLAADNCKNVLGIMLTGMGKDGAKGMLAIKNAGAHTIGQDEASCVVYGMPKAAYLAGAVVQQAALTNIPKLITNHFSTK